MRTWEEGREHKASFCKHNGEQDAVGGSAVPSYYLAEVLVQVQDEGEQPCAGTDPLRPRLLCLHRQRTLCRGVPSRRDWPPLAAVPA